MTRRPRRNHCPGFIRIGTGRHVFQRELRRLLDDNDQGLMPGMVHMLSEMATELGQVNDRIAGLDAQIRTHARRDADTQRLMEIPSVGPTIATALVTAISDGSSFSKARDLSAWLGLVPRQVTTGGKARLIGISKPATVICESSSSMGLEPYCTSCATARRHWQDGLMP